MAETRRVGELAIPVPIRAECVARGITLNGEVTAGDDGVNYYTGSKGSSRFQIGLTRQGVFETKKL
jgi:hypothetical protein